MNVSAFCLKWDSIRKVQISANGHFGKNPTDAIFFPMWRRVFPITNNFILSDCWLMFKMAAHVTGLKWSPRQSPSCVLHQNKKRKIWLLIWLLICIVFYFVQKYIINRLNWRIQTGIYPSSGYVLRASGQYLEPEIYVYLVSLGVKCSLLFFK